MNAGKPLDRTDAVPLEKQLEAEDKLVGGQAAAGVRVRFGERLPYPFGDPVLRRLVALLPEWGGTAMAKPERRDPAKEAFWRRMLLRFGRSTSTARDFCFEHELSEANFYAWRREIARRDREAPGSSVATARPSAVAVSPVFVNVRVADAELADLGIPKAESAISSGAAGTTIEVILAKPGTNGRRRLLVRPGFDADTLRQLLPLLESEEPKAANLRESDNREGSTGSAGPEKPSC